MTNDFSLLDVVPFLPQIFDKIASNLECYINMLEDDKELEQWERKI